MNPLISASELNHRLHSDLRPTVLDCRFKLADPNAGRREYEAAHIPGAYYVDLERDLSAPAQRHGGRHPLPDFKTLSKTLAQFGLNNHSHIVLYDASKGAFASRAWWLLKHGGLANIQLLDGGWQAWVAEHLPTESGAQTIEASAGNLNLSPGSMPVVHHQDILNHQSEWQLIDSRENGRYLGREEPIDPIAGHIPGARNLPWQDALGDDGKFKSPELLVQRWQNAGLSDADEKTVIYCGSGVTACVNVFALALTGATASLYPGSWSDWCSYVDGHNKEGSNRSARVATG
ncbi:sulfurtransferase [Simiduia aestuariiviva]|uniref:Thiosulfate/3-mercaptopyruvate sulfurtransferase n=1 Tax=Simiduia aestuariiviva TaxID=1510459 RepID=A0A839ULY4_9GAMM|nr:sulfurtransferase [Simiduia aestuariiviva]MBB3168703.1 thiosulfate/3-mercaptopyruvate sulfurtransferase [Simiduia aestuariiviva]